MTKLVIACIAQKGGVGKSTMTRLLARTYAAGGWDVKIADFNLKQLTSLNWTNARLRNEIEPTLRAEGYNSVKNFKRETADIIIADGKPDAEALTLEIAKVAVLSILPSGTAVDDLVATATFANELIDKGVPRDRLLVVFNRIVDNTNVLDEARDFLTQARIPFASVALHTKTSYERAQNGGRAISECNYKPLADRADELAAEIVDLVNKLERVAA